MMDKKTLMATAGATLVTLLVTMAVGWAAGIFERGSTALDEDQIEAVLKKVLVTDAGKTYGQTLAEVNGTLIAIDTKVDIIQNDIDKLELAVRELTK